MNTLLTTGLMLAQSCSGPFCAPDSDFERPTAGLLGESAAPVTALAADGSLLLAWEFRADGEADIAFNRRTPEVAGRWLDMPVRIDTDDWGAARSLEPRIAASESGGVWVLWQDARDGADDLRIRGSKDGGITWDPEDRRVGGGVPGAIRSLAAFAADDAGRLSVVWEDLRAGKRDLWCTRSTDGGFTWADETRVDSDGVGDGVSYHPQIVLWNDGTLLVTWWDERHGRGDVYVRTSPDGGSTWDGPEVRVDPGEAGADNSRDVVLARDGDTVSIAWEDEHPGLDGNVVSRTSTDRGQTWGSLVVGGEGQDPVVVARAGSVPLVAWSEPPPPGSGEKTSIGGRIVEIVPPTRHVLRAGNGLPVAVNSLTRLGSRWAGSAGHRAFFASGGASPIRGLVDVHWLDLRESAIRPRSAAFLQFGEEFISTDVDVRARSIVGQPTEDGALHLVWVTSYGDHDDLGYRRLQP